MFEAVARLQNDVALLGSAAGGKALSLVRSIIAVARGVYIGVVASALLYWYRQQCAFGTQPHWAASRAAIRVNESSRFIDFAEKWPPATTAESLEAIDIFTSALIVQHDLDWHLPYWSTCLAYPLFPELALASLAIGRGEPRPIARCPIQIGDIVSGQPLHH